MKPRLDYGTVAPGAYDAMDALDRYLQDCSLEKALIMLVQLRASQLNGCAYCLDMHWKDLRAIGENEQRLYSLDAWRECLGSDARSRGDQCVESFVHCWPIDAGHVSAFTGDCVREGG